MEECMRKVLLAIVGMALVSSALLLPHGAQAAMSAISSDVRATLTEASPVEKAACWRRRVCGPRGCFRRTVCRRW
jgi:hypothetical protein